MWANAVHIKRGDSNELLRVMLVMRMECFISFVGSSCGADVGN